MTPMRRALIVLALTVGWAGAAPATAGQGTTEKAFSPGGRVRMDLSAGAYRIEAGRDDRIVVRWESRHGDEGFVHVDVSVRGADASISARGPKDRFSVVIELPARTDIDTRLTAGDLRIRDIVGSKDIHLWAGDVDVDVCRPEEYRSVEAGVTVGELSATAFHVTKGGLFRSFSWRGPGKYNLKVNLTAGNVSLR